MGLKDAAIPLAFFLICIFGIAQSSITVKTYLDTKKTKDSNFNFSAIVLTISIIGLLASGFMSYKAFKGGASMNAAANAAAANAAATAASEMAGSQTNIGAQELGLANQLENISANAAARAAKAAEGAKLANALGATLGQLKQKGN
jgi:preprotein translocase subunit SecF